jgi:hypothetical protein
MEKELTGMDRIKDFRFKISNLKSSSASYPVYPVHPC